MEIATDASLAPGGDKSRTGVVVTLNGAIVHWTSSKQSLTAVNTCGSELNASMTSMKLGIGIRGMIEDVSKKKVATSLVGDNTAAIQSITTEVTSWRNRHYAMRAAWMRDMIEQ